MKARIITKKCVLTLETFAATMLLCFGALYALSPFRVSKWVGVSVGTGIFVVMLIILLTQRGYKDKRKRRSKNIVRTAAILVNAIADGIVMSSLFVYLGAYPVIWHTALLYLALITVMLLFCLLTNIPFFRKHYVIALCIYIALILAGAITLAVLYKGAIYWLLLMSLIPLIAALISTATYANDAVEHIKNLSYCSFAVLALVIIVVLLVISQGDGPDGSSGGCGSGAAFTKRRNPYAYMEELENIEIPII